MDKSEIIYLTNQKFGSKSIQTDKQTNKKINQKIKNKKRENSVHTRRHYTQTPTHHNTQTHQ